MNALLNPTLLFSVLLSAGYASLFHLWTGRNLRDLIVFVLASLVGFSLGQWAGEALNMDLFQIGQLHVLETTVAAFLALFSARSINL